MTIISFIKSNFIHNLVDANKLRLLLNQEIYVNRGIT